MKRGIALLIVFSLVVSVVPASAVPRTASSAATGAATAPQVEAVERSSGASESANYTTGRPVDNVTVEMTGNRLSLLVSDDKPSGTPLILNRSWLRSELGKPVEFMRFHREGDLVESYKVTPEKVFIDIPHFSTQNVTVTTVDGQFEVSGSASGQETQRVINYDVNETGIAILEIHGQGTREGQQRVDQFYSQVDNSTFQWETGEIPRNVTLEIVGQGEKLGPAFNKSDTGVSNGETVFFDLEAKDYQTNVTLVGTGQKNGTVVTKGPFNGSADGDTETVTFDFQQNSESFVLTGNTTTTTTDVSESDSWQTATDWDNAVSENRLVHESVSNTDHDDASLFKQGYSVSNPYLSSELIGYWPFHEDSGSIANDFSGDGNDGSISGASLGKTGLMGTTAYDFPNNGDYVDFGTGLLPSATSFTASVWINTNSHGSDDRIYVLRPDVAFILNIGRSGSDTLGIWFNGEDHAITEINTGEWYFVTIVWDNVNENLYAYVNGTQEVSDTSGLSFETSGSGDITIGGSNTQDGNWFDGTAANARLYDKALSSSEIQDLYDTATKTGFLETDARSFSEPVSPDTLNLTNVSATVPTDTTAQVTVKSDPDGDGTFEEQSNPISLDGSGGPYDVTGLSSDSDSFRLNATLENNDVTKTAEINRVDLEAKSSSTTTTQTEDPGIDVDGDGTDEASYTGKLSDGETVTVDVTEDIPDGTHTFTVSTANDSVVDWKYEGNNEARAHVKNFTLNGHDYTVDTFLADGEHTVITVDTLHTLQGQNSLTLNTYTDSETTHVSRIDVRGHYEGRTVVNNYTVNGQQSNLDAALADGESETVNISTESIYGTNDITVELKGNSTQDNYDAEIVWYPENRTYFSNVTVGGTDFESPTFLAQNETLVFNVTDVISPGDNDHVFRMQSQKTTTDTLDFVEKVNFYKNISVTIEEKHATYNKTSTETFDHTASNVEFNFSIPDRAFRHVRTSVVFNGTQTGIQNTTTFTGDHLTVQVDEEVPNGTEVTARIKLLKYRLLNADDTLRDENTLGEPYRVDVGVSSVTGNVTYETVEADLTTAEWEIILTQNGEPYNETTQKVIFVDGNVTVAESYFGDTDGLIVQRPRYSTVTYTGTVNTIHPTPQIEPNRTVVHRPALYTDLDQAHVRMANYSVQDLSSPLEVEWKQVGPYHLQWVTNEGGTYNQTIENVTSNGVSVFADGERYRNFRLKADGDLVIAVNGSTTWDVYQYDYPTVTSDTNVSVKAGQNKTVEIEVHNPNDFRLHDVELGLTHGWVESVEPQTQDIGPGETATFNVTIDVPFGTQETTYGLPMNLTSTETGEIDTKDIEVTVGGSFPGTAGAPISRFGLILGGVVLFAALLVVHLSRTGRLEDLKNEIEEI